MTDEEIQRLKETLPEWRNSIPPFFVKAFDHLLALDAKVVRLMEYAMDQSEKMELLEKQNAALRKMIEEAKRENKR